jgi:hypothetical protein
VADALTEGPSTPAGTRTLRDAVTAPGHGRKWARWSPHESLREDLLDDIPDSEPLRESGDVVVAASVGLTTNGSTLRSQDDVDGKN